MQQRFTAGVRVRDDSGREGTIVKPTDRHRVEWWVLFDGDEHPEMWFGGSLELVVPHDVRHEQDGDRWRWACSCGRRGYYGDIDRARRQGEVHAERFSGAVTRSGNAPD